MYGTKLYANYVSCELSKVYHVYRNSLMLTSIYTYRACLVNTRNCSAHFARQYFFLFDPVFCLFPPLRSLVTDWEKHNKLDSPKGDFNRVSRKLRPKTSNTKTSKTKTSKTKTIELTHIFRQGVKRRM